jgi:hypothetical protein
MLSSSPRSHDHRSRGSLFLAQRVWALRKLLGFGLIPLGSFLFQAGRLLPQRRRSLCSTFCNVSRRLTCDALSWGLVESDVETCLRFSNDKVIGSYEWDYSCCMGDGVFPSLEALGLCRLAGSKSRSSRRKDLKGSGIDVRLGLWKQEPYMDGVVCGWGTVRRLTKHLA